MQFTECDARDAKLLGQSVEPFLQAWRIGLHDGDADVGIEHIGEHQKDSILGCRLLAPLHEVVARARSILEQVIPALALGHDQPPPTNLQNVHLVNVFRESDRLRQTDGLAAIWHEMVAPEQRMNYSLP